MGWKSTITVSESAARAAVVELAAGIAAAAGPEKLSAMLEAALGEGCGYNFAVVDDDRAMSIADQSQGTAQVDGGDGHLASLVRGVIQDASQASGS